MENAQLIFLKGTYLDKLKVYVRLNNLKSLENSIKDLSQYKMGIEWESYIGNDYDLCSKFIEDAIEVPSIHSIHEIMYKPAKMSKCINKYLDYKYDLSRYEAHSLNNVLYFDKMGFIKIETMDDEFYQLKLLSPIFTMQIKYWDGRSTENKPAKFEILFIDKAENTYGLGDIKFSDLPTLFQETIINMVDYRLFKLKI